MMHITATPDEVISKLDLLGPRTDKPAIILFVSGASGAGKTHLVNFMEESLEHPLLGYHFFDRIGVLSVEEMERDWGSGSEWQHQTTFEWVRRFQEENLDTRLFIFEGQFNLDFAEEACSRYGVEDFSFVVLTVPDTIMAKRLEKLRDQPELVTEDMRAWSAFLSEQGQDKGALVLDTSSITIEQAAQAVYGRTLKLLSQVNAG